MAREQGRARTFTRRSLLLLGGQLGLFGLLAGLSLCLRSLKLKTARIPRIHRLRVLVLVPINAGVGQLRLLA